MEKLSFFKRLKLLRDYFIIIKRNRSAITDKANGLNLRIDNAGRLYTIYSCPSDVEKYGTELAQKYIKDYIGRAEVLFINLNLVEYIGIRDIEQKSELDFLIVFGFKGFDTPKLFRNTILLSLLTITLSIIYFLFL
jgi:hypothetical protein